jgi:hypothetical protein
MSKEWAHDAARKEVPTVKTFTLGGHAVVNSGGRAFLAVAGACPRGEVAAQLVQDRSGIAPALSAMRDEVVKVRPRMTLQKYPFMTHGAAINGAKLGPHRAWDPV